MELIEPKPFEIFESEADPNTIFIKNGEQIYARISKADYDTDSQAMLVAIRISEIPFMLYDIKKLKQEYNDIVVMCQSMEDELQRLKNQNQ